MYISFLTCLFAPPFFFFPPKTSHKFLIEVGIQNMLKSEMTSYRLELRMFFF